MRIKNLPSISSMDGSQDALVIEQTDGSEDKSRKVSPAQIKQYVLGNSIDDIYSVMGQMGAKNLIPYPYYRSSGYEHRSVTYTVDSSGKITANGTATGGNSYFEMRNAANETFNLKPNTRYIISGCPSGGGNSTYLLSVLYNVGGGSSTTLALDFGNGAEFTTPQNADANYTISVRIVSGTAITNLVFEPMLRYASDTDNTFEPYAKTNKQLTDDKAEVVSVRDYINELGVKNLLVPEWVETRTTENGVTYTFNADGTIIMNTDENGATANTNCNLRQNTVTTNNVFPAGTYILTSCPAGGSSTTYRTWARAYRSGTTTALTSNLYDEGNGVSFTVSEPFSLGLNVTVMNGYVCNNLTWKPMLRIASDINDDTYQPYAKTNRQLTEGLVTAREQISDLTTKKVNTWMPDVYDFDTKVKTLNSNICTTYVQKIGDLTVAYLGVDSGTDLGSFSTMMQLRGFPEGCTRCIGGYIYNSGLESSPRVVQASNVGVYFRPNITGSMSGFVCALLFFN